MLRSAERASPSMHGPASGRRSFETAALRPPQDDGIGASSVATKLPSHRTLARTGLIGEAVMP